MDEKRVRKVYKLNVVGGGGKKRDGEGGVKGERGGDVDVKGRRELEVSVLGAMALRSVTN